MKSFGRKMYFFKPSELMKIFEENPDLPFVVIAGENACIYDYTSMFCTDVRAYVGEILDCEQDIDPYVTFEDRDEFKEALEDYYYGDFDGTDLEFDKYIEKKLNEYEPYWTKCVIIYVDN